MTHIETELKQLKDGITEMFSMVISQLSKSKDALVNLDKDLAREVRANERRINSFELKLDRDCENLIALFNPVAIDLRFVIASLKINSNLERIGDIAEGIANYVLYLKFEPSKDLLDATQLIKMFDTAILMLEMSMQSYANEDTSIARNSFREDEFLNEANLKSTEVIADYIRANPDNINQALYTISTVRKLERVGDQCKNIAEEVIFYMEAKVLKHKHDKTPKN